MAKKLGKPTSVVDIKAKPSLEPDVREVGTNLVLLTGAISREVHLRALGTGEHALEFSFRCNDASNALVPVVWPSPPKWACKLHPGDALVLLGSIRRRFFSVAGVRQTRTEVVVERASRPATAVAQTIRDIAVTRLSTSGGVVRAVS